MDKGGPRERARATRVYVDHHSLGYGNLGDEAMLLSALHRLDVYLAPCEFVLPVHGDGVLPERLPPVEITPSPYRVLDRWTSWAFRLLTWPRRLPGLAGWWPRPDKERLRQWVAAALAGLVALGRRLGLPAPDRALQHALTALATCDVLYGVGDNSFNDFSRKGVVDKTWFFRLARPFVPVSVLSAHGLGPLETPWARAALARLLPSLDLLSFRDHQYSLELVRAARPARVRYAETGDEALTMPPAADRRVEALLEAAGLRGAQFVAVHFRTTNCVGDTRHLLPRLAGLLDQLAETTPHQFVFFPMSYHSFWGLDGVYGEEIRAVMTRPQRLHVAPVCRDPAVVKGAVARGRYSVGLSYHLAVFSLSQGHPALILYTGEYYRNKSEGLVGFYGPPSRALNLESASNEEVVRAVQGIEADYSAACDRIRRTNATLIRQNDWMLCELARLLGRPESTGLHPEPEPAGAEAR
jgi:polysaccharide pyruvyl transferase WcaK-like protein